MGELADVELQEFDTLLHAHLGKLVGVEGRQLAARLMQGVELLLFLRFGRHIAAQAYELRDVPAVGRGHRRNVQFEIAIVMTAETGGNGFAGKGGVEGTVIGAEQPGRPEHIIETPANHRPGTPFLERRVGPGDLQVGTDDRHAVRENVEDPLRLEQVFAAGPDGLILRVGVEAVKVLGLQQRQPAHRILDAHHVPVGLAALDEVPRPMIGTLEDQNSRSIGHV